MKMSLTSRVLHSSTNSTALFILCLKMARGNRALVVKSRAVMVDHFFPQTVYLSRRHVQYHLLCLTLMTMWMHRFHSTSLIIAFSFFQYCLNTDNARAESEYMYNTLYNKIRKTPKRKYFVGLKKWGSQLTTLSVLIHL